MDVTGSNEVNNVPERVAVTSATHKHPRSKNSFSPTVVHHHSLALNRDIPATLVHLKLISAIKNWKKILTRKDAQRA